MLVSDTGIRGVRLGRKLGVGWAGSTGGPLSYDSFGAPQGASFVKIYYELNPHPIHALGSPAFTPEPCRLQPGPEFAGGLWRGSCQFSGKLKSEAHQRTEMGHLPDAGSATAERLMRPQRPGHRCCFCPFAHFLTWFAIPMGLEGEMPRIL